MHSFPGQTRAAFAANKASTCSDDRASAACSGVARANSAAVGQCRSIPHPMLDARYHDGRACLPRSLWPTLLVLILPDVRQHGWLLEPEEDYLRNGIARLDFDPSVAVV